MAGNEFNIVTKNILDPQQQMVRFNGVIDEGENVMIKLSQMVSVQNPEVGGEIEKVQGFVTRTVPTGKRLKMAVVITCDLIDA